MCSNNVLVQRQEGALAIRNIVSRLVAKIPANGNGTASSDQEASVSAAAAVRDTFLDLGGAEVV